MLRKYLLWFISLCFRSQSECDISRVTEKNARGTGDFVYYFKCCANIYFGFSPRVFVANQSAIFPALQKKRPRDFVYYFKPRWLTRKVANFYQTQKIYSLLIIKEPSSTENISILGKFHIATAIDMPSYIHTYFRHIVDKRGKLGKDVVPKS